MRLTVHGVNVEIRIVCEKIQLAESVPGSDVNRLQFLVCFHSLKFLS